MILPTKPGDSLGISLEVPLYLSIHICMILFDGCSWTFGDGVDPQYRFTDLIGGINIGECGKSNDGILRTTINHLESNDNINTVIIQWTVNLRTEFRKPDAPAYNFIGR